MNDTEYKGYYITHNAYGNNEYTVQYDGDDCYFDSEEDAKKFIDGLEEDHFDDKEDELDFDDSEFDPDEVLVEEGNIGPYTVKDLALGVIDLLNSDSMDYNTGVFDKRDQALEELINMPIFDDMPQEDVDAVLEDLDYAPLQKFIEKHPEQAEDMFSVVADWFGFSSYGDYKSYIDWVDNGGEDEYLRDLDAWDDEENYTFAEKYDKFEENKKVLRREATNAGAIPSVPGPHKKISLDETENPEADNYYAIMDILDDAALNKKTLTTTQKNELDSLASEYDVQISDIADANDCGPDGCKTWDDLVTSLGKLFDSGDRVSI